MSTWAPGESFGKYRLVEQLGAGGMAETWRAELLAAAGVRKAVVIKRVLPWLSENKRFIEAFIEEAKITASLSHGNIAQVFDFGQVGDSHFIAMELIDGRSLDRVLKNSVARGYWHMPFPIAALITLEVAKGLEHVHTRRGPDGPLNIVHRDVSPDNIIVGLNGETKLVDFGVAKAVLSGRRDTEAGVLKGKYLYFSPEQAHGDDVDFRTDIYALGVVAYRLVTGRKAFDGPNLRVLVQIQQGEFAPVRVANPEVPEPLAEVIETMMSRRKEDRFGSTIELVEALSACLRQMAPSAATHWIRDYTRWLYAEELKVRGEQPELRSGFLGMLEGWKPGAPPPSAEVVSEGGHHELATLATRAEGHQRKATGHGAESAPSSQRKPMVAALAVGAAVLAFGVLAGLLSWTHSREPDLQETRSLRPDSEVRMQRPLPELSALEPEPTPEVPDDEPAPVEPEPPAVVKEPDEKPAPAPARPDLGFSAEKAPVTFTLSHQHHVSLEKAIDLKALKGELTGAVPHPTISAGNSGEPAADLYDVKSGIEAARAAGALVRAVPVLMFVPGTPPTLQVLNDKAEWAGDGVRLAVLVASAGDVMIAPPPIRANGKPIKRKMKATVVEPDDRFSIRDLSKRASWKVTVTAAKGVPQKSIPPVLLVTREETARVDGKPTAGGYAVLGPGTHKLSGASGAWLTVPTLPWLELPDVEVRFSP